MTKLNSETRMIADWEMPIDGNTERHIQIQEQILQAIEASLENPEGMPIDGMDELQRAWDDTQTYLNRLVAEQVDQQLHYVTTRDTTMAFGETELFTEESLAREGQPTLFDEKMLAMVALGNSVDIDLT